MLILHTKQQLAIQVHLISSHSDSIDARGWLDTNPAFFRDQHIPLPPADILQTPSSFRVPVSPQIIINGLPTPFIDKRLAWVFVEEQTIYLPYTSHRRNFNPTVTLSSDEVVRLSAYLWGLTTSTQSQASPGFIAASAVFGVDTPTSNEAVFQALLVIHTLPYRPCLTTVRATMKWTEPVTQS